MEEPKLHDIAYFSGRQVRLDEPWSEVCELLDVEPGLLVLVLDAEGAPVALVDQRAAQGTERAGHVKNHLDSLQATNLVEPNLSVSQTMSAMRRDSGLRWCVFREGEDFKVVAPEAIQSAYLSWSQGRSWSVLAFGGPRLENVYGVPLTPPPPTYQCSAGHTYNHPPPRDKYTRPWCQQHRRLLTVVP
jgi:hypothetical protein